MFYLASALLVGEGLSFSKHSAVHAAFGNRFARTKRAPTHLHRYLLRAFEVRQVGDYDIIPLTEAESSEQIARAKEFLRVVEPMLTGAGAESTAPPD